LLENTENVALGIGCFINHWFTQPTYRPFICRLSLFFFQMMPI